MSTYVTNPNNMAAGGIGILIAVYEDQCLTLRDGESEWVLQTPPSEKKRLKYSSACIAGDNILVTGGIYSNATSSKKCWKLNVPTLNWTPMPDLNVARGYHATLCVGNQIYVLGGWDWRDYTTAPSSVEYLDKVTEFWHVTCDMPRALVDHTAVNYKHFIYVFGGHKLDNCRTTFMLDTVTKKWSRKADIPESCRRGASLVYRDRIYVLCGNQNCCMSYDPDQDVWTTHSQPAVKHDRASALVWGDRILLFGGVNTSVIEEYNPDTDTWSQWKYQLPVAAPIPPAVFAIHM